MTRFQFLRVALHVLVVFLLIPLKSAADMVPRVFRSRKNTLPLTPTGEFYIEDIAGPPKSLKQGLANWRLTITGKVDHPIVLNYRDLLARPSQKRIITLNCIGNLVGGHAIGNAEWEGIPLASLLEEADPHFFARFMNVKAADGYHDSLPLKKGYHPGALLATKMNGKPLNPDHGFPLRLIIPGFYGIKQVKWLQEIEISNQKLQGHWQKKGWSEKARVKIFSRIDSPENGETLLARSTVIRGIAFAGDRGIQYVQVSTDGEKTWSLASLQPPLSSYSWVFWSFSCRFHRPGRYTLSVRAADQYSGLQADDLRDPFPSGTSGIHRIEITVT